MSIFFTGDDVAFPSDLWEIPVCSIPSRPHTHVVLHLEIRIQDSETASASFKWGDQRRNKFLDGCLVLFWTLVATFNSAAMPTYLGLSALSSLIFSPPPLSETER